MRKLGQAAGGAVLALVAASAALAQDDGEQAQRLVERVAPATVSVRVVLHIEMVVQGQAMDREQRAILPGLIVSSDGLIMITNSIFDGSRIFQGRRGMRGGRRGGGGGGGFEIDVTPGEVKVVLEGEEEELAATVVARDDSLDLAFLKIDELGDRELSVVEITEGTKPALWDEVFQVNRLGEGFDYSPVLRSARISGKIKRPRRAWALDGNLPGLGLPVFSSSGQLTGVLTSLKSGPEEGAGHLALIVPAKAVQTLIAQAKEQVAESESEQPEPTKELESRPY